MSSSSPSSVSSFLLLILLSPLSSFRHLRTNAYTLLSLQAAEIVYLLLFRGKLKLSQILETLATRNITSEEKDREDAAAAASSKSKKDKEKDKKGKSKRKNQMEESEDEQADEDPFASAVAGPSKKKLDSKSESDLYLPALSSPPACYL